MSDARRPRLLVPDNTPLSLLSMLGEDALNWLFRIGAEVWITDMVVAEALREPDPGADARNDQRRGLREWLKDNSHRIRVQETEEGRDYMREVRNWTAAGSPAEDKPSRRNRGERSIAEIIPITAKVVGAGEAVVLLVDDRAARAVLAAAVQTSAMDADIMSTQTFIGLLASDFGVAEAATAWEMMRLAADGGVPRPYAPDPILVRRSGT